MDGQMSVRWVMYQLGGVATTGELVGHVGRAAVAQALRSGEVERVGHGRVALAVVDDAQKLAHSMKAVASHLTAALSYGWHVKVPPESPCITVPRNRNVPARRRSELAVHWADLAERESDGWRTSPVRTVLDCAKTLPFDEALVVADSALRAGIAKAQLVRAAGQLSTRGRQRCLRVVESASPRSANAFESVLRAIALGVPGLQVEPQVPVDVGGFVVHPDLVDTARRLAIEADSFAWHGDRAALKRDCERYDELVAAGWRVLRFAWEQVMFEPEWVASMLARAAGQRAILPKSA